MRDGVVVRAGAVAVAAGGAALFVTSFLPGWVDAERRIVGYGQARVVSSPSAWEGFFAPWLPLAAVAGLIAFALVLAGRWTGRRTAPFATVPGAVALAALAAALVMGTDNVDSNFATDWVGHPDLLTLVGLLLAGLVVGGGVLSALATRRSFAAQTATLVLLLTATACGAGPEPVATSSESAAPDWRTDPNEPYPFTTPVPPLAATRLDGTYEREPTDTFAGERAACRRCPPYPLDRGSSLLTLDRGRYEVRHEEPPYRGYGHFVVDGETVVLFNDPECSETRGIYVWEREGAELRLEVVEDDCAFGQRARDLMALTWTLTEAARGGPCQPPNTEAAISGHWPAPSGC